MKAKKDQKALLGSGLLLAIASSLCCIVPLLAIAGVSMTAFAWVAPLRPYLLTATFLVLAFAFYQAYKPSKKKDACGCDERKSWLQSKTFLWTITVISLLLSAFPYYAKYLQPASKGEITAHRSENEKQAVIRIEGMTCEACEGHVDQALLRMKGVWQSRTSYTKGTATVQFDSTQLTFEQLAATIEHETGYKVKH